MGSCTACSLAAYSLQLTKQANVLHDSFVIYITASCCAERLQSTQMHADA